MTTTTTPHTVPAHIADAIRTGRVTERTAAPYPRLLALVRRFKKTGRIGGTSITRPSTRRKNGDWLRPTMKGQRFRTSDSTQTSVITGWDANRIQYFNTDDPNTILTLRRDEFTEKTAEWLPSIQVWPTPSARTLSDVPRHPAPLIAALTSLKEAA